LNPHTNTHAHTPAHHVARKRATARETQNGEKYARENVKNKRERERERKKIHVWSVGLVAFFFVDLRFFRQLSAIRLRGFAPLSSIPLRMVGQPQLRSLSDRDCHINRNCSRFFIKSRQSGDVFWNGSVNDR